MGGLCSISQRVVSAKRKEATQNTLAAILDQFNVSHPAQDGRQPVDVQAQVMPGTSSKFPVLVAHMTPEQEASYLTERLPAYRDSNLKAAEVGLKYATRQLKFDFHVPSDEGLYETVVNGVCAWYLRCEQTGTTHSDSVWSLSFDVYHCSGLNTLPHLVNDVQELVFANGALVAVKVACVDRYLAAPIIDLRNDLPKMLQHRCTSALPQEWINLKLRAVGTMTLYETFMAHNWPHFIVGAKVAQLVGDLPAASKLRALLRVHTQDHTGTNESGRTRASDVQLPVDWNDFASDQNNINNALFRETIVYRTQAVIHHDKNTPYFPESAHMNFEFGFPCKLAAWTPQCAPSAHQEDDDPEYDRLMPPLDRPHAVKPQLIQCGRFPEWDQKSAPLIELPYLQTLRQAYQLTRDFVCAVARDPDVQQELARFCYEVHRCVPRLYALPTTHQQCQRTLTTLLWMYMTVHNTDHWTIQKNGSAHGFPMTQTCYFYQIRASLPPWPAERKAAEASDTQYWKNVEYTTTQQLARQHGFAADQAAKARIFLFKIVKFQPTKDIHLGNLRYPGWIELETSEAATQFARRLSALLDHAFSMQPEDIALSVCY